MNNQYENVAAAEVGEERVVDLRELFSVLLSKALWILLCMAICVAGAIIYTKAFLKPQYRSTAVIYVNDGTMSNTGSVAVATCLAEDYAKTIKLETVLKTSMAELGITNMSHTALASRISVSLEEESRIVVISLTDESPARAQTLCNKICEVSKVRFEQMTEVERVSIYEEATFPAGPSGPSLTTNVILGAMIGLVLPCAVILLIYMIDDRIKTPEDVQRTLKLSTLGNIPFHKD